MPDAIYRNEKKRDHRDIVKDAAKAVCRKLPADVRQLSYDEIVDCYWSQNDRAQIKNVFDTLVANSRKMSQNFQISRRVKLENDALPLPLEVTIDVWVREPESVDALLWPKEMMDQSDAYRIPIPEVNEIVQGIAEAAFNRGLLTDIVEWLADNCKTHQQAAWLFPMWEVLLRFGGMSTIANNCSSNTPQRALPPLPPFMRQKLRYMNNLMAAHMLMETFDKPTPQPEPSLCTMTLASSYNYQQYVGDAVHFVSLNE